MNINRASFKDFEEIKIEFHNDEEKDFIAMQIRAELAFGGINEIPYLCYVVYCEEGVL